MLAPGPPVPASGHLPLALLGLLLGLAAGSFLATLVLRAPAGLPVTGRSRCDVCLTPLGPRDLVPLLSFLAARGRCRHCSARIHPLHPALEALAGLLGALSLGLLGLPLGLAGALLGWILLALAALDLRHHWLPDWLTLPLLAAGLATALLLAPAALPHRLAAAALAGGTFWLVRVTAGRLLGREALGLGDVKLAAALGAWLSPALLPPLLLLAASAGLAFALAVRGRRGGPFPVVPFGAFLAAAAWPLWLLAAAGAGGPLLHQARLRAEPVAEMPMPVRPHGLGGERNRNVMLIAQGVAIAARAESAGTTAAEQPEWSLA